MTTLAMQAAGEVFAAVPSKSAITGYFTSSHYFWLGLLIGLAVGLWWGRMRGLRQLGESDFRIRSTNVRGISRWL